MVLDIREADKRAGVPMPGRRLGLGLAEANRRAVGSEPDKDGAP